MDVLQVFTKSGELRCLNGPDESATGASYN
jgi:hypothetical protein